MVQCVQHQSHNEEGSQSSHGRYHLDNQEEDQTLLTSQEVVAAVSIPCQGNDGCLSNHGNNGDNQGVEILSTIEGIRKEFLEVIKTEAATEIKRKGTDVTSFEG